MHEPSSPNLVVRLLLTRASNQSKIRTPKLIVISVASCRRSCHRLSCRGLSCRQYETVFVGSTKVKAPILQLKGKLHRCNQNGCLRATVYVCSRVQHRGLLFTWSSHKGKGPGSVNPAGRIDQNYLCTFDSSTQHDFVRQMSHESCFLGVGLRRHQEGENFFTG